MKIFISYASEHQSATQSLASELRAAGHRVFFDRHDLAPGETFTDQIRKSIEQADLFIFLISPEAVTPGRYTMSELQIMQELAPSPAGRVLPVMAAPTLLTSVPDYLRNVTILTPAGDLVADVYNAVAETEERTKARRHAKVAGVAFVAASVVAILAAAVFAPARHQTITAPANPFSVYGSNFVGWGQTAVVNVTNSRPDYHKNYTCKVIADEMAANVQSVEHDPKCETITIKAKKQPFIEKVQENSKLMPSVSYDRTPISIELMGGHGEVIWRGNWEIGFQNFVDQKRFSLRKLDSSLKPVDVPLTAGPAHEHLFELLLDGAPLGEGFHCRSDNVHISVREGACIFQVGVSSGDENYILSDLNINHPASGWSQNYQINTYQN